MKLAAARRFSSFLAVPALAFALSACSDSKEPAKTAEAKPEAPAAAAPATPTPVTPAKPAAEPAKEATAATPAKSVTAPEPQGSADVAKLMEVGALPDKWLGPDTAPVIIIEYASMTCGHCANFTEKTFPELKKQFIDTGKVRYVLREFPFDPRATAAFMLARCSGDNYYPLVDVLFRQQRVWAGAAQDEASAALFNTVKIAGFSQESFDACLKDQQLLDNVNAVRNKASDEFKVEATPTFFINGKKYSGDMPIEEMAAIVQSME